jgi:hypothetical protein
MKGQAMIMTAIVMVLIVVSIRNEADSVSVVETADFQRRVVQIGMLENIRDEYENVGRYAFQESPDSKNIDDRMANFTRFVQQRENVDVLFSVASYYPDEQFDVDDDGFKEEILNISVGNFLDEDITVTIEHNHSGGGAQVTSDLGSVPAGTVKRYQQAQVTGVFSSPTMILVNVSYTGKSTGVSDKLTYTTTVAPRALNTSASVADVTLRFDDSFARDTSYVFVFYNKSARGGGINVPLPPIQCPIQCG